MVAQALDGQRILAAAKTFEGTPYALPPDGVNTLDCSLFVLFTYRDAGYPFQPGIRTAEEIRQECEPIGWDDVQPGDLLFYINTYEAGGKPGPDGRIASHIGISFGAGSGRMWDAVSAAGRDGVGITDIRTQYWQSHMLEARRYAAPAPPAPPAPGTGGFVVSGTGSIGLRVRSAPNTDAAILGTLPEGTHVTGDEHAWRRVQGLGLNGWAADTYLKPSGSPTPPHEPPAGVQDAIDVSNYQAADLTSIIRQYGPTHIIVRASTESDRHRAIARQQIRTALAAGCSVSAYIWAYFDLEPVAHTADAMSVMDGFPVDYFWVDCEDVCPPGKLESWLSRSAARIENFGKQAGVYTSRGWWQAHGDSHGFSRLPLWAAQWDEVPTLESVVIYGGWRAASAKQYTTTGETLDRNVFSGAVC